MNTLIYHIIDISMLCIILYSSFIGYIRGIWRSSIYFISWITIIYITYHVFYLLLPYTQTHIGSGLSYSIILLLIIGGMISVLFTWFAESSSEWINNSNMLNWLDDLLGLFYGFFRSWIFLMFAWLCAKPVLIQEQILNLNQNTKILPAINTSIVIARNMTPNSLNNWLAHNIYKPIQRHEIIKSLLPHKMLQVLSEQKDNDRVIEVNELINNNIPLAPETTIPIVPQVTDRTINSLPIEQLEDDEQELLIDKDNDNNRSFDSQIVVKE